MKVKVEFVGEGTISSNGRGYWVKEKHPEASIERWYPTNWCTPILPDFGDGDLVEHGPSGARGVAKMWASGEMFDSEDRALCIEVPQRPDKKAICVVFWPAVDCRIVRKAGETE
jgi:hypothetical protein